MRTHRKALFTPLLVLLISLNVGPASAQRTKKTARKPTEQTLAPPPMTLDDKETIATVERLLAESGQKFVSAGAGVWIIRRTGPNLASFQIVLSSISGTLVTEVIVVPGKSVRIEAAGPYLLRLANKLDYVKVGLDVGGDLFVRNEVRVKSLDVEEFKSNIERVAIAADRVFVEVKPFRQSYEFMPR